MQALKSTRIQRIKTELEEEHPLDAMSRIIYRLDRLEEKLDDYSTGDYDKLHSRLSDMQRTVTRLVNAVFN